MKEFIIICLEVDESGIESIAQSIRQKIETIQHTKVKSVTVSLGVTLSKETDTVDSIIKRADEGLYLAKDEGRNCVRFL